jgi:protein-ribulosamine 3-kinase
MSPKGKFGFHCTKYNGSLAQDNIWTDTWEEYYKNNIVPCFSLRKKLGVPARVENAL